MFFENGVFAQFSGHTHVFCYRKAYASEFSSEGNFTNIFIVGNSGSMSHPYPPDCESQYRKPHFAIVNVKGPSMTVRIYDEDEKGKEFATIESTNENYFHSQ
jgi:hypothetical protein